MNLDLRFYWSLFLRRFPVMALFVLVCSGLGVITALKLPETYYTSARLLVESPQISNDLAASTVQSNAIEQLDIIEQRLMTRANLIDIANRFDVFADIRAMSPDEVVGAMRANTRIRRSSGRDEATLMTIGFDGRSARIVQAVVNEYVTLMLESNVQFRMSRAENTLEFFQEEVRRLGEELSQKSAAIVTFKSENADALPEDQSYRLDRQTLLQERLSRTERDLSAAQAQRRDIISIFETTGSVRGEVAPRSPEEQQLIAARAELRLLKTDYTDTNPRVIRLQNQVDRLEAVVEAQIEAGMPEGAERKTPEEAMLEATLSEVDSRIENLTTDMESTEAELDRLATSISSSSANGIQLAAIERDFDATQSRYQAAVQNLNAARLGERIETTAQGQRVTVIENANVPNEPSGPNRPKVALAGAAAGIGLAAAYFVLLEFLNRTIRRPAEVQSRFGIVPLASIPYMESRRHRFLRRAGLVTATLIVIIGVPIALWYIDQTYLPLDLVVQKGLDRLGLG